MKLEKRRIWIVVRWQMKGGKKESVVLSAFSTKEEARNKLNWYVDTYTKSFEEFGMQEIETWFPTEY